MASKKQKGMVFHQEGATTPVAAPAADHPPARFIVLKPGKASEGGMEQSIRVTNEEAYMGKPNMYPSEEPMRNCGGLPAVKHPTSSKPQPENLSPDSICKGIKVVLDNNSMWNEFFRCKTEMIVTQQGSRMFPYCRFRISGLQPSKKYSLMMDIQLLDNSCYKWTGNSWQVAGKAECHGKSQPFAHPESPSMGQHWMQNPVSFYKLKLTNNVSEQGENTILHPMHRYLPQLHVVQTDNAAKDINLNGPSVVTFTFPQTEFMAVTAYQNSRLSQLKVDYNPFAKGLKEEGSSLWGLKQKLNSVKDSNKDGGTTTNEQHAVKKSLKSLLANHKPRSSKAVEAKPSGSGDLQKNSTTNEDQSAANVTGECSNSLPAQKLFSELIREAHVSLHRCNLEQMGTNNSTSHITAQTNTKTPALKSNEQDVPKKDSKSVKTQSETSPAKKCETIVTKKKVEENKDLLNSLNCKDNVSIDCSEFNNAAPEVSQNSSVESDHQRKPKAPSEVKVKQQKRPAPLPLPALALFLKQHSTKSKMAKSKLDYPAPALPSEILSDSQSSAAAPKCPPSDHSSKAIGPSKDHTSDIPKSDIQASGHTGAHLHPDEIVLNVTGQTVETSHKLSSPSCPGTNATKDPNNLRTDDFMASVSVAESTGPERRNGTPVLPNLDQPFCTLGTSISTISSTLATSSASTILSPPLDTVLPDRNSPQIPTCTESSTLPSDSPIKKSDSLLPDPECSPFGFEDMSPARSPEPLPSLPISLALELDYTTSEATPQAVSPEELHHSEASVFQWHTVLPLPKPYIDTSFTTFQPTPHILPLASITSPVLPSQTPPHPEPQAIKISTSMAPLDATPSFQENEQPLPFPDEYSPLALQLPLSPTFSSLDGDGLSPTPSIADLVHFFSSDHDLGMGVEFSNTEALAVSCPTPCTVEANEHEPSQQVQPNPANKPCKRKKMSRQRKIADIDQEIDASTHARMQPSLEEVEEQLFISFTSKEALKLHIADSSDGTVSQPQTTPEGPLQQIADAPENETAEGLVKITAFEKILLRDLKLLRHRQVIHPVLQEVGLKMSLLDTTLAIDLQYLGVRLPVPPPGVSLEPLAKKLPPPQGVSAAFVSRTGKTTDVTQIKGWREKFTPTEAPSTPTPTKPEAGPSSDLPKKNLSAFCSDMLDEYLESEGKLIDERADSFSQPLVEPIVYDLPARSTSYVRTLDSVLKKQTASSPTSDLISGFIPPSKRPKLSLRETKTSKKEKLKLKVPKNIKPKAEPAPGSTPALSPAESNPVPKKPAVQNPAAPPSSEHTAPITEPQKSKKDHLKVRFGPTRPVTLSSQPKQRKMLKLKPSSQTLSPHKPRTPPPGVSEDMAPVESDSELRTAVDQSTEPCRKDGMPVMTRALLRQKNLEDGVVWDGLPRTSITEERASIALTSLFTLKGFVSENPTAPIQLVQRQAPPCMNEFCRLGCICSSLSHCSRISHCGRPPCMLGCNCLKQKVVLLKNLDGSDSSPTQQGSNKKRKRRMKMAYVLKEADSVSQPAERVRTLWKREAGDSDPDPIRTPGPAPLTSPTEREDDNSSCARVRAYAEEKKRSRKQKRKDLPETCEKPMETPKDVKPKLVRLKSLKGRDLTLKDTKTKLSIPPPAGDPVQPADRPPSPPAESPPSPPAELPSKPPSKPPSKRLIIMAQCQWARQGDRNILMKKLCKAMARDKLEKPFWIKKYLICPMSQTVEESGADRCIQYKMHISRPNMEGGKPSRHGRPKIQSKQKETKKQQEPQTEVAMEVESIEDWQREVEEEDWEEEGEEEAEPLEDWQREVEEEDEEEDGEEEAEPLEDWQREVEEEDGAEEAEPLEDWQREVEEGDIEEEAGKTDHQVHDGRESNREEIISKKKKEIMVSMGLPFLTGVSPAGILSANTKQPGRTDPVIEVNGKPYPLAKIQLGKMGALHPANRLAAYLTGRVGSNRKQAASSSCPSKPPQSSGPTPPTISSASSVVSDPPPTSQPSVTTSPTDSQVSSSGAPPESLAPKASQVLMRQVSCPGTHSLPALPPNALPPNALPPNALPPGALPLGALSPSSGKWVKLQPVQTASGCHYYRTPDGKLVQLVPLSQLRSVIPNASAQKASPAASLQTPVVPVDNQTPPRTTVPTPSSSSSSSPFSLSGFQSFSVSPLTSSLCRTPTFLSQKGKCSFKIFRPKSRREPIVVTFAKGPTKVAAAPCSFTLIQPQPPTAATPMNLISLKPSTNQGAELGVKTVAVSAAPVDPDGDHQKPATQTPAGIRPPLPPPASPRTEVTLVPPPELACKLMDLDIICVDNDTGHATTEKSGGEKQSVDVVKVEEPSSETDTSSDFGDELDSEEGTGPIINYRHLHNAMEKQRRGKLRQLFEGLSREMGLREDTSNVSTLNKAVKLIQQLRTTETDLQEKKRRLTKSRDMYLTTITPTTDINVLEAMGLLNNTDELMEDLADEESKSTNVIPVTKAEDGAQSVAMETVKESSQLNATQRRLARIMRNSQSSLSVQGDTDAFKALGSVMNSQNSPTTLKQEIHTLQSEKARLKSLKICLVEQRDAFIREIAQISGKSKQKIQRKLQHLSSKQRKVEKQERRQIAGQLSDSTDDDVITSSNLKQHAAQAPPTPVSAPPTATPAATPAQTPAQPPQSVLQALTPILVPLGVSHNASVVNDRLRTVPNILSRSKKPAEPPYFQPMFQLVGTALPGQQVLTLSQMMVGPAVLQTSPTPGVASVTLNLSSLTNQKIHITSLPHPPTDINNLLQVVQPSTTQYQMQQQPQQIQILQQHTQQQPPSQQQQVPAGQPSSRADPTPEPCSSSSPPFTRGPSSSQCPGPSADRLAEVPAVEGPLGAEQQQQQEEANRDDESLTSLLNEIVFLNQQTVTAATTDGVLSTGKTSSEDTAAEDGAKEQEGHAHSPWLLELDSDSEETTQSERQQAGHATKGGGGVLAPPPLLQMKVGGADKEADPASSDEEEGGGGKRDGGMAWRPMPRLVPLGLRGNPPS